jgi:phosphoserine aminotransferase
MSRSVSVVLLLVALGSLGVPCHAEVSDAARADDHDALRALRVRVTEAINTRDVTALRACLAKEFVFTAVDQTVITD